MELPRPRSSLRGVLAGLALAALVWVVLCWPLRSGPPGYGELNAARAAAMALVAGTLVPLRGAAPPATPLEGMARQAALLNAWSGVAAVALVLLARASRALGLSPVAGFMGEDLGAIAAVVVCVVAAALTSVAAVALALVALRSPRAGLATLRIAAPHAALGAAVCALALA